MGIVGIESMSHFSQIIKKDIALVIFFAPWCVLCHLQESIIGSLCVRFEDSVRFGRINLDANPVIGQESGIEYIPTIIVFRNGAEAQRLIGFYPDTAVAEVIERQLRV